MYNLPLCHFLIHEDLINFTLSYLNKISFLTTLWFKMTKADKEKLEMKGVRPRRTPFISHLNYNFMSFRRSFSVHHRGEKPIF